MRRHSCSLKPVSFSKITEQLVCVKRILFRYEAHIPKVGITNCHNTDVVPPPPPPQYPHCSIARKFQHRFAAYM